MIEVKHLYKTYVMKKGLSVKALDDVSLKIDKVGMVFLLGKSGAGKSTLLNVLGGLDLVDKGEIIINGKSSKDFTQSDFDSYRNTYVGFIFQEYNILNEFTIAENIALAIELQGRKATDEEISEILEQVDLVGLAKRKPNELSGGQKQRVAIARALIKKPQIIMADEPTGALDSKTGKQIFDTLKKLSQDKLVLVVSHDREFAEQYADRIIELKDGKVISDVEKEVIPLQKSEGISVIDNKILKIDHNYHLTNEDFLKIRAYIEKAQHDIFISFDEKNNDKIKTAINLTDDGQYKFVTTRDDIKASPNETCELIKSKLGLNKAFKMGFSSLKVKKFRLVLTIFLSFIAFMMFGVANTISVYNNVRTTVNSISDSKIEYATFAKQQGFAYDYIDTDTSFYVDNALISDEDCAKIMKDTNLDLTKVYGSLQKFDMPRINYLTGQGIFLEQINNFTGYTSIDNQFLEKYGFTLEGRLPNSDDEIVITKIVEDAMKENGVRDFDGKEYKNLNSAINLEIAIFEMKMKIVGVVDTNANIEQYKDIKGDSIRDFMEIQMLGSYLDNGPHLLFFVHYDMIEKLNTMFIYTTNMLEMRFKDLQFYFNKIVDSKKTENNTLQNCEILVPQIHLESLFDAIEFNTADKAYIKVIHENEENTFIMNDYYYYLYSLCKDDLVTLFNENNLTVSSKFKTAYQIKDQSLEKVLYMIKVLNDQTYASASEIDAIIQIMNDYTSDIVVEEEEIINLLNHRIKEYSNQLYVDIDYTDGKKKYSDTYHVVGVSSMSDGIVICDDTLFTDYMGEESGKYKYVFDKMPTSNKEIRKLVEYNYIPIKNIGGITFIMKNEVVENLREIDSILKVFSKIFFYVGLVFAIFASLLLLNFITISINYKKREIGILRAVGARSKDVFKIFFSESLIIAIINAILANISLFIVVFIINNMLRRNYNLLITILNPGILQIILVLGISILVAFISSFFPVYFISKKKPIDAINNR